MGTGLYTAQVQLIAEELCVPLNRVKLIQCDTALTPDQGTTSGAQSHPTNFNQANLAQACATAREALKQLASTRLAVSADRLEVKDGVVSVKSNASQKVTYGELIGGKKFNLALDANAKRKPASEWTILGKPIPRFDIPAMATGQFEYVHNVRVPGMLHGQVVRPPSIGASVMSVDESSVKEFAGRRESRRQKEFRRRRRREAVAGHSGRRQIEGGMDRGHGASKPERLSMTSCGIRNRLATHSR